MGKKNSLMVHIKPASYLAPKPYDPEWFVLPAAMQVPQTMTSAMKMLVITRIYGDV